MPVFNAKEYYGKQGLTAADRSASDQAKLNEISGNSYVSTPSFGSSSLTKEEGLKMYLENENFKEKKYLENLEEARKNIAYGGLDYLDSDDSHFYHISSVAEKTSPYYKKYGNRLVDFTEDEWKEQAARYMANLKSGGEEAANFALNSAIKDRVSVNQPLLEKWANGVKGFGTTFWGALASSLGVMDRAIGGLVTDDPSYGGNLYKNILKGVYNNGIVEGYKEGIINYIDHIVDNPFTRYGNDVNKWGSFTDEGIAEAKAIGLSNVEVVQTNAQENGQASLWDQLWNANTGPILLQQAGFTAEAALEAWALGDASKLLFGGAEALAGRVLSSEAKLETLKAVTKNIKRAQTSIERTLIPGFVGSSEGAMEGLETKIQTFENGLKYLQDKQHEVAMKDMMATLDSIGAQQAFDPRTGTYAYVDQEGNVIDTDSLYKQSYDKYQQQYNDGLKQLERDATIAGVNNFLINSVINGFVNYGFQAGLQHPAVRRAMQNNKLYRKLSNDITERTTRNADGTVSVKPELTKARAAWNIVKEPLGEFIEEYSQTLSDKVTSAGALNSIQTYINNKYDPEATTDLGSTLGEDLAASWSAFTDTLFDQQTIKAGIMGALGSILGAPNKPKGTVMTKSGKRSLFGKEYIDGVEQSNLDRILSIPERLGWRSGILSEYTRAKRELNESQRVAKQIEEWANDPNNKDKFTSTAGMLAWARDMEEAASKDDEFGYRNSLLGKALHDIFMLKKLEGTEYYDSVMDQLTDIASAELGSKQATDIITTLKGNVDTRDDYSGMSDEDILNQAKKRASDMLDKIDEVGRKEEDIHNVYGEISDDTKEMMIYGEFALEDIKKRKESLKAELDRANQVVLEDSQAALDEEDNTVNRQLPKPVARVIAKYGSFQEAKNRRERINEGIKNLEEENTKAQAEIDVLKKKIRNNTSSAAKKKNKEKLDELEETIQTNKALIQIMQKQDAKIYKDLSQATRSRRLTQEEVQQGDTGESDVVLTPDEILSLDPYSRAVMFSQVYKKYLAGKRSATDDSEQTEEKSVYSPEQQEVVERMGAAGRRADRKYIEKMVDYGKLVTMENNFLKEQIKLMRDKHAFNKYAQKAKREAAKAVLVKKADAIAQIQDYTDFATALDEAMYSSSQEDKEVLISRLKDTNSENFNKYMATQQSMSELFSILDKIDLSAYDNNEIDLFTAAINYLAHRGVDLYDENQRFDALKMLTEYEEDTPGKTKFEKYVDSINKANSSRGDLYSPIIFTDTNDVVSMVTDLLSRTSSERERIASDNARVQVEPEANAQQETPPGVQPIQPQPQPQPQPAQGETPQPETPAETPSDEEPPVNLSAKEAELVNKAKQVSNERVADTIRDVIEGIKEYAANNSDIYGEFLETLYDELDTLLNTSFSSEEALFNENGLNHLANSLRVEGNQGEAILLNKGIQHAKEENAIRNRANRESNRMRVGPTAGSPSANTIATVDFIELREEAERGGARKPLWDFLMRHNVLNYIETGYINRVNRERADHKRPNILFYTDADLTRELAASMGDDFDPSTDTPVILIVQDDSGSIDVNGVKYQPIAILPSAKSETRGSAHTTDLIRLITSPTGIIMREGNPVSTTPSDIAGGIKANISDRNNREVNDLTSLIDKKILNTPDQDSQDYADAKQRGDTNKINQIWNKFVEKVIDRLRVGTAPKADNPTLTISTFNYVPQSFDGKVDGSPIRIRVKSITQAVNSEGKTLIDLLSNPINVSTGASSIRNFNSRTTHFFELFDEINTYDRNALDGEGDNFAQKVEKLLNKKVRDYFYFPQSPYTFKVYPKDDNSGGYDLILQNPSRMEDYIVLGTIPATAQDNNTRDLLTADILSNLIKGKNTFEAITDPNSESSPFANYQANFHQATAANTEGAPGRNRARDDLREIINDGLLEVYATTLDYQVNCLDILSPLPAQTTPNVFAQQPIVTDDTDNASPVGNPVEGTAATDGGVVDSDTGAAVEGNPSDEPPRRPNIIEETIENIKQLSSRYNLTADGSAYVDENGKLIVRVSDIESSTGMVDEWIPGTSPWETPSTTLGNIIDQIVRDFFGNTLRKVTNNPNTSEGRIVTILGNTNVSNQVKTFITNNNIQDIYIDSNNNIIIKDGEGNIIDDQDTVKGFLGYTDTQEDILTQHVDTIYERLGLVSLDNSDNPRVSGSLISALQSERYDYPNFSHNEVTKIVNKLTELRNQWTMQGWHVEPTGIKAIGQVMLEYEDGRKEALDVGGTLDLLLWKDDGTAKVVDIKTIHRSVNETAEQAISKRKPKWTIQTQLYKTFMHSAHPLLNFVDSEILSVFLDYDTPSDTNKYTASNARSSDGLRTLQQNGSEAIVNAEVHGVVSLSDAATTFHGEKLSAKARKAKLLNEILSGQLADVSNTTMPTVNSGNTVDVGGFDIDLDSIDAETAIGSDSGDESYNAVQELPFTNSDVIRSMDTVWSRLDPEIRKALEKKGMTEEIWNSPFTKEEVENNNSCVLNL